jgi:hypothetical protein
MPTSLAQAIKETFWLGCLGWGILLMISASTEGVPYTSIHISEAKHFRPPSAPSVFFWPCSVCTSASASERRRSKRRAESHVLMHQALMVIFLAPDAVDSGSRLASACGRCGRRDSLTV